MNTIGVLMAFLLLSYLGSSFGGKSKKGKKPIAAGLPSGSEFLVVGALAGPLLLDLVTLDALKAFDPLAYVAVAWLALSTGLEYGYVERRRVPRSSLALGVSITVACGAIVAAGVWATLPLIASLAPDDRLLLAGGIGCVTAETTRQGLAWIVERTDAKGPLSDLLAELAHSDEIVPLVAVAFLFAIRAPAKAIVELHTVGWAGATLVVGVILGVLTTVLLARDRRIAESWGTILGTSLMTIGLAARLDLAGVTAMFALGATISLLSRHRQEIQVMVGTTERAVSLPLLVIAGARIDPSAIGRLAVIVPVALFLRVSAKLLTGAALLATTRARKAGPLLGLGLLSSGGTSVAIGLALALRFPGAIGDTILATAVASSLLGEVSGPLALRRILGRAGEIPEPGPASSPEPLPMAEVDTSPTSMEAS